MFLSILHRYFTIASESLGGGLDSYVTLWFFEFIVLSTMRRLGMSVGGKVGDSVSRPPYRY